MKNFFIVSLFFVPFLNLEARTTQEAAEFCLQAKDFSGCMKLMNNNSQGNQQNKDSSENGNSFEELNKKLKNNRKDPISLLARAKERYANLGDFLGALNDIEDVLKLSSSNSEAYFLRGVIKAIELEDFEKALLDINQASNLNKSNSDIYASLGYLKSWTLSNHEQGLLDLNKAINFDTKNSLAYYFRGLVQYSLANKNLDKENDSKEKEFLYAAKKDFSKSLEYYQDTINPIFKRLYPFGYKHLIFKQRADINFDLGIDFYKKEKEKHQEYINKAIEDYSSYIEFAPTLDQVEKLENQAKAFDPYFIKINGYTWRGNAYTWTKKSRKKNVCSDYKKVYKFSKQFDDMPYSLFEKYHFDDSALMEGFLSYGEWCR